MMRFLILLLLLICIAGGAWLGYIYTIPQQFSTDAPVIVFQEKEYGTPHIGGSFSLIDHEGHSRTEADFKGKILLVYFGYSFCPDICPSALYNMSQALDTLGPQAKEIQPLFITIDPTRDTIAHLARYRENYHPNFVMLTGSEEQIQKVMKAYKVHGAKVKPDGTTTEYLMDHTSIIYIMDRQGRFIAHFNHLTPSKELKEALIKILK
ncbi:MAG: SCO family protein [Holosporales bacterium]|nr:SCO family protein [Holosporales bacterium]